MENVQVRVVHQTLTPNITRLEAQSALRSGRQPPSHLNPMKMFWANHWTSPRSFKSALDNY